MSTDTNVVPLSPPGPLGTGHNKLPAALIAVRDTCVGELREALQALFENADDTLFGLADKATSNLEQNAYFEAMRDLRLKRKNIERSFLQRLFEAFVRCARGGLARTDAPLEALTGESLSLLNNDDLEESVAIDAMVAKVLGRDGQAFEHLTQRIGAVLSVRLDPALNPLGPKVLGECFLQACGALGVEIRVKLIILKLFEKSVLGRCAELYQSANQLLIEAGVLPEIKAPPAARRKPVSSTSPALNAEDEAQAFGALQTLLSQVRASGVQAHVSTADAQPITQQDLMRLLSHLQHHAGDQVQASDADLRAQVAELLAKASAKSGRARVVGAVDEDVINLVSMLFEFILDDRTLPDSLKALIGRMQIPMLKVAVLDKSFFSRGSHPARRLLNEIASAAMGWSDQDDVKRDQVYVRIEQVVQRLLNDFVDDTTIFNELLADFTAFTGSERRRSELLERRTRDAEEGRAKAELARREVQLVINERIAGRSLPKLVVRLLQEAWSKVLMLVCLKHGVGSEAWQQAVQTMEDLIWSVEPHEADADRLRMAQRMPDLLKALREGMADAALDPFVTRELFAQLQALHLERLKRRVEPSQESLPESLDAPLLELPPREAESESAPTTEQVVEEIVLLAPGEAAELDAGWELPEDDDAWQQVDRLHVGSWLEFTEADDHKVRCKLAAAIKATGKYIFVNRTGMKVLEKSRQALAVEFRRGSVRLLDDALLFDRALESVIGNLRRLKNA